MGIEGTLRRLVRSMELPARVLRLFYYAPKGMKFEVIRPFVFLFPTALNAEMLMPKFEENMLTESFNMILFVNKLTFKFWILFAFLSKSL